MGANERMQAAEGAMQKTQGYTFDPEGNVIDVPRGTSDGGSESPPGAPKRRGMDAMAAALNAKREAVEEGAIVDEAEPAVETRLKDPGPSDHPVGTIEWWADQMALADDLQRMDDIRVAALEGGVNTSDDAEAFRELYRKRWNEIKRDPARARDATAAPISADLFS